MTRSNRYGSHETNATEEINVFRTYEKRYRRQPTPTTRKERRQQKRNDVDDQRFSEVIDFRDLKSYDNSIRWSDRVRRIELPCHIHRYMLDGDRAEIFEIVDHPGLVVIKDALSYEQQLIWAKRALCKYSLGPYTNLWNPADTIIPLWQNGMDSGELASFRKLRWANIGRHYDWTAREYVDMDVLPSLDADLIQLYDEAVALTGLYTEGSAQAGIVNFYPSGTSMGGHLDNAEADMISPIVSLSIGCSCIYLQGGYTRSQHPLPIWLNSGDIVVMGDAARSCYHGVPLVTSGTLPDPLKSLLESEHPNYHRYLSHARININLRSVDLRQ